MSSSFSSLTQFLFRYNCCCLFVQRWTRITWMSVLGIMSPSLTASLALPLHFQFVLFYTKGSLELLSVMRDYRPNCNYCSFKHRETDLHKASDIIVISARIIHTLPQITQNRTATQYATFEACFTATQHCADVPFTWRRRATKNFHISADNDLVIWPFQLKNFCASYSWREKLLL